MHTRWGCRNAKLAQARSSGTARKGFCGRRQRGKRATPTARSTLASAGVASYQRNVISCQDMGSVDEASHKNAPGTHIREPSQSHRWRGRQQDHAPVPEASESYAMARTHKTAHNTELELHSLGWEPSRAKKQPSLRIAARGRGRAQADPGTAGGLAEHIPLLCLPSGGQQQQ